MKLCCSRFLQGKPGEIIACEDFKNCEMRKRPMTETCKVCKEHAFPDGPSCGRGDCPYGRADELAATLSARGSTHGDFTENGKIMQSLKELMRTHAGWSRLSPAQREALEMIQHKIGRILCGNPNFQDHWHDIAGYAKLVEDLCKTPAR